MSATTIILLFVFFVFPALLITSGAYLYSVHRLPLGLGMVLIIGLIYLCFYGYAAFFGSYGLTLWQFVLSMTPSFFVLSTMILALIDNVMTEPDPTP